MDPILIYIICLVTGAVLGALFARLSNKSMLSALEERLHQQKNSEEKTLERLGAAEGERESIRREKESLNLELTRKNADFENLRKKNEEQQAEMKDLQERFTKEFENLANKILDDKSKKFTTQNKENLDTILKPLQEKIQQFEKKVEETNKEQLGRNAALREQIASLKELNTHMTKEAENLTKALKGDTKTQGNWGEVILERILEQSGLQKDREYFTQQSETAEGNRQLRPDIVVHLPGDKRLVIDSKVSLNAYERYANEADEKLKTDHLKAHLKAIRTHVKTLNEKNYQQLYPGQSPDFVLLFVPIEPAFALASIAHPELYAEAFEKNIIIVTPTTLLAVLRTIDSMWQNERQQQNAVEIATRAGKLYDKFVSLTDELIKVGKQIGTVQSSYENAMKKLTGRDNLIKHVENLRELGVGTSKRINQKLLERATEE